MSGPSRREWNVLRIVYLVACVGLRHIRQSGSGAGVHCNDQAYNASSILLCFDVYFHRFHVVSIRALSQLQSIYLSEFKFVEK